MGTLICKCGKEFETTTKASYCSRSCASKYSYTQERLEHFLRISSQTKFTKENVLPFIANGLRKREWYKYSEISEYLTQRKIEHQFEYHLSGTNFIYDLALFDYKSLIEFDERYHRSTLKNDLNKCFVANDFGWLFYQFDIIDVTKPYPISLIQQKIEI